jgi:CDP-diacylglycerol---serine O-phosphatidyltransferase
MNIKKHIPNTITSLNLVAGVVSITFAMENLLVWAAVMVFAAAVFDYLDGLAARLLEVYSEMGKQLDSLADVVSFGVAPAIIVFKLLSINCAGSCNILDQMHITPYFALLIPVCSALRLAKFNIDLRQEVNFIGLPTPANGLFFASIPLVLWVQPDIFSVVKVGFLVDFFSNTRVLAILPVLFSYLLISDFKIFSMKIKSLKWKGNELRFILVAASVLLFALFSISAIPMIIVLYILLSIVFQGMIE